ncbi:MAG: nucleotidyltransferase domain-containing protein [Lachnospiraceae bacterium]|nr:nucleotidyltransferase domain-containing protein [Lachnospiraceae bacterium]
MELSKNIELSSDIIEKIKIEVPDMIRAFMEKDLVKMILYGSCARGDFKKHSDVDIALLTRGSRTDSWKYNDRIDEVATELALEYFAIVNFVLLPYDEFEEKKNWYGYFKNIETEGVKLYG